MKKCLGIEIGNYRIKIAYMEKGVLRECISERIEEGAKPMPDSARRRSGIFWLKNDPLQCRVFVKQLNQKLNYFTVSVKRGW